jgi:GMP synthase (glutamine-hydrolysing)
MKSPRILIIQNDLHDGPSYLAEFLESRNLQFELVLAGDGDPVPRTVDGWDAIAVLGGPMGVNDGLAPLRETEKLLADAVSRDVPVIAHCLGGQLLAHALGAKVTRNPLPEIGWGRIDIEDDPLAHEWFGASGPYTVFQWHSDTFEIPAGARRLAGSQACRNQAFAIGKSLGMQFHIEIDANKGAVWQNLCRDELISLSDVPTVQQPAAQRESTAKHLASSTAMAQRIYTRWLANTKV